MVRDDMRVCGDDGGGGGGVSVEGSGDGYGGAFRLSHKTPVTCDLHVGRRPARDKAATARDRTTLPLHRIA
jgi:hypothetical protein